MAWSASAMFQQWLKNPSLNALYNGTLPTTYTSITADTIRAALFNNSVTPDKNAAVGSTGYNTGTWVTANEVTDTNWAAKGIQLANDALSEPSGAVMYDADDTTHTGTVTLASVYGCLVLDDTITGGTVVDQGVCFNYFGGSQSVTAGTFTIVWHANGVFRFTV